eukprot:3349384-Lingulodinium_polyedra.AAC.1
MPVAPRAPDIPCSAKTPCPRAPFPRAGCILGAGCIPLARCSRTTRARLSYRALLAHALLARRAACPRA